VNTTDPKNRHRKHECWHASIRIN